MRTAIASSASQLLLEEVMHGRTVLFAPVYMGSGAILWFAADQAPSALAVACVMLLCCVGLLSMRHAGPVVQHSLLAATLVLAGMLCAQWQSWRAATIMLDSPVTTTVTGRISEREIDDRNRWHYTLDLLETAEPAIRRPPDQVSLVLRRQDVPFDLGDVVRGKARLGPPAGPALPGLNDFAFSAYFDGTGANGYFYGMPQLLSPAGDNEEGKSITDRFLLWLSALRSQIGDRIRLILPGDTGAFAASLVNDERRAISPETTDALRVSGLAHIIAISGLNMALSAGIFYVGLRHLLGLFTGTAQARSTKKIAAVGALVTVTAYYFISGFGVSAERAFIMMAIMLVAVLFDRPSVSLRNVALSAIIIIVLSPSQVLGPSFQMSYAATVALVSGYSLWTRRPSHDRISIPLPGFAPLMTIGRFFAGIATTSFIGGASTAIFSIEHFHRLATYGLVANLAAMPVVSFVVMPVGMLAMLLMPFGLDTFAWQITGMGLDVVISIAKTVAAWGGNVPFARLPTWFFPVVVAGFLLMMLLRTRLRYLGVAIIAAAVIFAASTRRDPDNELLIAEDGDLVALLHNGRLEPNRTHPDDFIFDQWQRALATEDWLLPTMLPPDTSTPVRDRKADARLTLDRDQHQTLRQAMAAAFDTVPEGGFACHRKDWCAAILEDGDLLLTIGDAAYLAPACDTADIVVIPARLRIDRCRSGAKLLTGASLRRSGSVEIDLDADPPIATTAFRHIARDWQRHRAYDWHSDTFVADPAIPDPVVQQGAMSPPSDSGE